MNTMYKFVRLIEKSIKFHITLIITYLLFIFPFISTVNKISHCPHHNSMFVTLIAQLINIFHIKFLCNISKG